jgi:hypothetical protein
MLATTRGQVYTTSPFSIAAIAGAGFAILFRLKKIGMTRPMTNLG